MASHKLSNRPIHFDGGDHRKNPHYDSLDSWLLHCGCLQRQDTGTYSIALVYTCKQVYHEAILIPYQKNTFSFDDRGTLNQFLMTQTPVSRTVELAQIKRRAIRSLQLHAIYMNWHDVDEWNTTSYNVVKYLKSLEHLELFIDLAFHDCRVFGKVRRTTDYFMALHELPLKTLEVDVIDPSFVIYVMNNTTFRRLQCWFRLSVSAKNKLESVIAEQIRTT